MKTSFQTLLFSFGAALSAFGCLAAPQTAAPQTAAPQTAATQPEVVSQEIDQRTRGVFPFGAPANVPLRATNYPIPSGALFVSPDGKSDAAGTRQAPLSVSGAIARATEGATLVFRGGVYRGISYLNISKRLTLQAAPGELPLIKGSKVLSGFQKDENGPLAYRVDDQASAGPWTRDKMEIDASFPQAGLIDMAFLDGKPLRQVMKRSEVAPGAFYADAGAKKLYFGDDPGAKTLEFATSYRAFNIGGTAKDAAKNLAAGTKVRGLSFSHFTYSALKIDLTSDITLEKNVFAWNGVVGAQFYDVPGAVVRGNTFACNGMKGMDGHNADGLLLEDNEIHHNNVERFWPGWSASGVKAILSSDMVWRRNLVRDNFSHGLWWDISISNCAAIENTVVDNDGKAIMVELGDDCLIAFNTLARNQHGVAIWDSSDVRVWNNTLAFNGINLEINDTTRLNDNKALFDAGLTWRTERLEVANNLFAGAREWEINGAQGKWQPRLDSDAASWFSSFRNNLFVPKTANPKLATLFFAGTAPSEKGTNRSFATLAELLGATRLPAQLPATGLSADTLFVQANKGDFQLRSGASKFAATPLPSDVATLVARPGEIGFIGASKPD